jgi:hypothetical protein
MFKFLLKQWLGQQYKIFMVDFNSKNIKNLMQLHKLKGMRILNKPELHLINLTWR